MSLINQFFQSPTHSSLVYLHSELTLEEIEKIDRSTYDAAEESGIVGTQDPFKMQELMWSDPGNHKGFKKSGRGGDKALTRLYIFSLTLVLARRINIHIW